MIGRPKRTEKDIIENITFQLNNSYTIDKKGCWVWTGLYYPNGYPRISRHRPNKKFHHRGHIASYELHKGRVIKPLLVCHSCDNKGCINPDHLWLGTNQENQIDARDKGVFAKYWTKQRRKEQSEANSGEKNPMHGWSGELAPCYGRTGKKHPMYGKKQTEETKKKISETLKNRYKK